MLCVYRIGHFYVLLKLVRFEHCLKTINLQHFKKHVIDIHPRQPNNDHYRNFGYCSFGCSEIRSGFDYFGFWLLLGWLLLFLLNTETG